MKAGLPMSTAGEVVDRKGREAGRRDARRRRGRKVPLLGPVEDEAMDEAGAALSDEELLRTRIVGEPARASDALRGTIEAREERHLAAGAVDAPDGARRCRQVRRTELAGHELGARRPVRIRRHRAGIVRNVDRNAIGRGRGEIDVGRRRVVDRDAEDLADLLGGDRERLGDVRQAALRAKRGEVETRAEGPLRSIDR